MERNRIETTDLVGFFGRVLALILGVPIYLSLLATLPAVGAVLLVALYFGVPMAVRRAVADPMRYHADYQ